jgi:hypothetical protein
MEELSLSDMVYIVLMRVVVHMTALLILVSMLIVLMLQEILIYVFESAFFFL